MQLEKEKLNEEMIKREVFVAVFKIFYHFPNTIAVLTNFIYCQYQRSMQEKQEALQKIIHNQEKVSIY